ncbi:MAG: permease prefix domain 1-containing protein [Oscillospiraceae bacterium]|nr:permease prefix domain 1-containing protein [Oscillospiraceae bacterium]
MNERISKHIDELFMGVEHTRQAADIKEELAGNLQAKYDDLLSNGLSEEEAFENVISGIGDIKGLLGAGQIREVESAYRRRQTSSLLKGLAITLFVVSAIPIIFFTTFIPSLEIIGVISSIGIVAAAVGIVVYAASIKPEKYKKGDDTFVEEYKEKVTGGDKRQRLRGAVSSTLWLTVVTIYLAVSFMTHSWHLTWLIFLAGALAQNIVMYMMGDTRRVGKLIGSTVWTAAIISYFVIGFLTGQWFWGAFVFLVAALLQQLVRLIRIWNEV